MQERKQIPGIITIAITSLASCFFWLCPCFFMKEAKLVKQFFILELQW
jgi:hypothetical protein